MRQSGTGQQHCFHLYLAQLLDLLYIQALFAHRGVLMLLLKAQVIGGDYEPVAVHNLTHAS